MHRIAILHVEDEEDHRLILERMLAESGMEYRLHQCEDVPAMFSALKEQVFDICLLDFSLGLTTAKELLPQLSELPVVVVTVHEDDQLDSELMRLGAADFVAKSELSPSLLKRVVRHAVERQTILNQLKDESEHDALTGVFNRRYGMRELRKLAADYRRYGYPYTLCLLDMDNLKCINDNFGHLAGDAAIRALASAMSALVREGDSVVRLGGDEFLVLLPHSSVADAEVMLQRLAQRLASEPLQWQGNTIGVSASAGLVAGAGGRPESELEQADKAMYARKREGRE